MQRKTPPLIKVYEAIGAIADQRILIDGFEAKVRSSSRNKYYDVHYDASKNAIMSNDNGSYRKGYLGYPSIAFLMKKGILPYVSSFLVALKEIPRKDWNTKNNNDFEKTTKQIDSRIAHLGVDPKELDDFAKACLLDIESLGLVHLGEKQYPPQGY